MGVFSPLKKALAVRQSRLFHTGVRRIEKADWLEHFIEARESAVSEKNILAGWRGAGLFPENLHRMLHQFSSTSSDPDSNPDPLDVSNTSAVHQSDTTNTPFLLNSSPPPPATLRSSNLAFLTSLETSTLDCQSKTHIRRLSGIAERLQAENHILGKELDEIKGVQAKRKERVSGKRVILKGKFVVSTEEIQKALEEAEQATSSKKKFTTGKKRKVGPDINGNNEVTCSDVVLKHSDNEIVDCIEVEF